MALCDPVRDRYKTFSLRGFLLSRGGPRCALRHADRPGPRIKPPAFHPNRPRTLRPQPFSAASCACRRLLPVATAHIRARNTIAPRPARLGMRSIGLPHVIAIDAPVDGPLRDVALTLTGADFGFRSHRIIPYHGKAGVRIDSGGIYVGQTCQNIRGGYSVSARCGKALRSVRTRRINYPKKSIDIGEIL